MRVDWQHIGTAVCLKVREHFVALCVAALNLRGLRLPPPYRRDSRSSGLLLSICWYLSTDISGQPTCITSTNKYKVVQIWPGLFVCKQVTVCPGHIWTTLYQHTLYNNSEERKPYYVIYELPRSEGQHCTSVSFRRWPDCAKQTRQQLQWWMIVTTWQLVSSGNAQAHCALSIVEPHLVGAPFCAAL